MEPDYSRSLLALSRNDEIFYFVREMFGSLSRTDQRRWAETYLRGLLLGGGTKELRKITQEILTESGTQSIQQFINQSPWDWVPVRSRLGSYVDESVRKHAWIAKTVVIPKRGQHSVGVEKRFVPEQGRVLNCQVGVGLFAATDFVSVPVDWRIALSRRWVDDEVRRVKARIPHAERPKSQWAYVLEMLDEMWLDWRLAPAPLGMDMRMERNIWPAVDELLARRVEFVLEIGGSVNALAGPHVAPPPGSGAERVRGASGARLVSVRDLARQISSRRRELAHWAYYRDEVTRSDFISATIFAPTPSAGTLEERPSFRLIGEWPRGADRPKRFWLTNMTHAPLKRALSVIALDRRTSADLQDLQKNYGLRDFEGRSFRGWHHHMTLVSAAFAFAKVGWEDSYAESS